MRNYELMTIAKSNTVSKEIQDLIVSNGGTITKADAWGKRKLAYEIKGLKEAHYDVVIFQLPAENLDKVTAKMKLMDGIVRYLFTVKK